MYIGAESIVSPLGKSAEDVFRKISSGITSLAEKRGVIQSSFTPNELDKLLPNPKEYLRSIE